MQRPLVGLVMVVSVALSCTSQVDRSSPAAEAAAARFDLTAARATSAAPHDARSPKIRLKGYALDVLAPPPAVPAELDVPTVARKPHAGKRPVKWIVQFQEVIGAEHQRALAALGARAVEFVPDHGVVVAMDDDAAGRLRGLPGVRGATRLRPAYKIDPALKDDRGGVAAWDGRRRLAVRLDEDDGIEAAVSEVHRGRGEVVHVSRGLLTVNVRAAAVARLARLESVLWIEEVPALRLLNDTTSWTVQTFRANDRAIWAQGLRGRGQIVGMGDSGVDHDMCFFRDPTGQPIGASHRKIVGYASFADAYDGDMGHGTHVAGTVAGDQSPVTGSTQASGMAPEARLFVTDLTPGETTYVYPPSDLGELFVAAYLAGARLHTNSWGATANGYDAYAWSTDRFAWEHKDFLPFFANGNAGPAAGTVGTPATAKDAVSVGATQNGAAAGDAAFFSSHGPTVDGRTKPTVMAPGVSIVSADSDGIQGTNNCGTVQMSGTSMATPAVAGAAALVRQYYVDGYWPYGSPSPARAHEPSAALVKATLVNSARNMSGQNVDAPIPSTGQGWGRVTLDDTLRFAGDSRFLEVFDVQDGLQTGAAWTETFFVSGGRPLKVTLVWTDYPGSNLAEIALVNDLDLVVTAPDGETRYAGNAFTGGASAAGGAADRLNVEEQVLIPAPQRGRYTVTVSAHEVVFGPQPFAVVVTGGAGVTSTGLVGLDRSRYGAPDTIRVEVSDADPDVDPAVKEEVAVTVTCGADTETVALVESGPGTGVFDGALPTGTGAAVPGDGVLQVSDGAAIVATYLDADDGSGAPAVATGAAQADLTPPRVSSVAVTELGQGSAVVSWSTDEPTSARIDYGTTPALGESRSTPWLTTVHTVQLPGLREATAYRLVVVATDEAGNVTRDANGGVGYGFTTASLPPEITVYSSNSTSTVLPETVIFGIAADPSGVVSLLVNDVPATYRASDGYYERAVALALGDNPFVVFARDGLGNETTARIVVTRVPPPDLTITSLRAPDRGGVGERIQVDQTLCNLGAGPSVGSGLVEWFLSTDAVITPETDLALPGTFQYLDEILPGECLPFTVDLDLPLRTSLVGSTYVVGVYVDVMNDVWESDETNNATAGTPLLLEGPDLVVSSVSAPAVIETGTEFVAPVTVANLGPGACGGFAVAVYLSPDATVTKDDLLLASGRTALRAGTAVDLPFKATVTSAVPPGEYWVGAIVDPGDEAVETNEVNNTLVGGRVVVHGPDLVVTAVDGPASASGGSTVTITATVAERGGGAASAFSVGLFLSTDDAITRSDLRIGGFQLAGLARGESVTVRTAVTLPPDLALGTYRLGAVADDRDAVQESDETNNALAGPSLRVLGADLFVVRVAGPATALPGGTIQVTTTVGSNPAGTAAADFHVGLFLSSDATITSSDRLLATRHVAELAPGAESTETTPVTIPWDAAGTYYLGAIVDDFPLYLCDPVMDTCAWIVDVVKESDETNNATAGNAIFVGNRPDLVVAAVTGPATAVPGATVNVSTTVTNGGTLAAAATRVGIYLSTDAAIGEGDVLLGTRSVPSLAPGAASTGTTAVTLPAGATGTFWLGAVADLDGAVAEADEVNNARAAASPLVVGSSDLALTAVVGPASAAPGATITVSTTVTNTGTLAAAATRVGIYLSTDVTIGAGDLLLGTRTVPALAPGAASTDTTAVTLPANAAGTYWLGAVADLDGAVAEPDEVNNALAAASPLVIGSPDLAVTAVVGPATAVPGATLTVTTTVANVGALAAAATRVGIYLSTDATIGAGDLLLGTRSVPALAPGAASTEGTAVTLPGNAAGTYWLGAVADLDGVVAEGDETNNALAASSPLAVNVPDLAVTAVSGPATAVPGGTISVSTTVTNLGSVVAAASRVGIYLSTDPAIGEGDVLLGTRSVPALAPGAASTALTTVTFPAGAAATSWLGAIADLDGAVAETDEVNNARAAATPITVVRPNLAITAVSGPAGTAAGAALSVTFGVANRGDAPSVPCTVGVFLRSTDPASPAPDVLLSREAIAGLAARTSVNVTRVVTVPVTVTPGAYNLGAIADLDGVVAESDEGDNTALGTRLNVKKPRN